MKVIKTYRFRIKDSTSSKHLDKMAESVNYVWNYCNQTSYEQISNNRKWLTEFNLNNLTVGCTKELGISGATIQFICKEYVVRRKQAKKIKLNWRTKKRSLGWIPIKTDRYVVNDDVIIYHGHSFRFWKSQQIIGILKTAKFSQDAKRNWYINIQSEINSIPIKKTGKQIGIDLGIKTIVTCSDGSQFSRENFILKFEPQIKKAIKARKRKKFSSIHNKIKNSRLDWTHKITTNIVNKYDFIFVGDVNPTKINKTNLAKLANDAGWYMFKSLLAYKAIRLGKEYKEVNENFSTVTCSTCLNKTGPSGLSTLGVREWTCSICGTHHDRDVNAAENILRFGHESPKGIPFIEEGCQAPFREL